MIEKLKVNIIDPELSEELQSLTSQYAEAQQATDLLKWQIAAKVNDGYSEHKGIFAGDKIAYFAECSRVANDGLDVALFGSSGQTLRRWAEVESTWHNFPEAQTLLEATSFKHLEVSKKAAYHEKVSSPLAAMQWALAEKASADDMQEHYFPPMSPTEYDKFDSAMSSLLNEKLYVWIQSADVVDAIMSHVRAIDTIRREYQNEKGKAI